MYVLVYFFVIPLRNLRGLPRACPPGGLGLLPREGLDPRIPSTLLLAGQVDALGPLAVSFVASRLPERYV